MQDAIMSFGMGINALGLYILTYCHWHDLHIVLTYYVLLMYVYTLGCIFVATFGVIMIDGLRTVYSFVHLFLTVSPSPSDTRCS